MNLLIVDDEIYIVRALQKNIDWKMLGVDQVFLAYNAEKAKAVFQKEEVDILITDIEMPRESGLDLLEWVREENYSCKAICLTCHAEFQYAQKALQYQVSEYILKPVDFQKLKLLIQKMVKQIWEEGQQKEYRRKGVLWEYNQKKLESAFWRDLLKGAVELQPGILAEQAQKVNVEWDFYQQYQLILCSVKRIYEKKRSWEEDMERVHNVIYNLAREVFLENEDEGKCGWMDGIHMWAVIPAEKTIGLQEKLENFVEACYQRAGIGILIYQDEICYGEELRSGYQRLMQYDRENVFLEKGLYSSMAGDEEKSQWSEFYLKLRGCLRAKRFQEALEMAASIWDEKHNISPKNLILNVGAGLYEIYRCLEENKIQTEQFWDPELSDMIHNAYYSAGIYKEWLKTAIQRIEVFCAEGKQERKVIIQIKSYVEEHIEERISREDIAEYVSFSTDYISRVFKKEMGVSLSEYIMEQKIERARQMMEEGEDSIGNIAVLLGYNSFSYFSELFRRFTGMLPSEYKRSSKTE